METETHKYNKFTVKDLEKAINELCKADIPRQHTLSLGKYTIVANTFDEAFSGWLKLYKEKYEHDI